MAAVALVTLPVLPLTFLGIPGPEIHWLQFEDLGKNLLTQIKTNIPGADKSINASASKNQRSSFASSEIKVLDETAKVLIAEAATNPEDPYLHNRLGLIYAELGELNSAVTHFQQSIKCSRTKIRDLTSKSNLARTEGEYKKASNCMLEISALNVQLAASHSSLARVWEQLGKSDKVIAQLEELNKDVTLARVLKNNDAKEPPSAKAVQSRLTQETAAMLARADALKQAGRTEEAMREYKKLSETVAELSIVHREYGLAALSLNNLWLAQQELTRAVELDADDSRSLSALGAIYSSLGKYDEARNSYEKALLANPNDGNAAYNLGNIYADMGQYQEAIDSYKKAISSNPSSALAHNNLATMHSLTGDYGNAISSFKSAIHLAPNMASAHYGMGIALMNARHYKESASAFKQALALNPALTDAHNKLELANRKSGLPRAKIN